MEKKTQGGVGEIPNTPSNLQEALQALKSVSPRLKTHFFDMSTMPMLNLVSATLRAKFYELNGVQPHFPALSLVALNLSFHHSALGSLTTLCI